MSQAGVHDLLDAEEFGSEYFAMLGESQIHLPAEVSQSLIINEKADQNSQRRQSGGNGRDHQLSGSAHDNLLQS
jgi:hypothetical protein